MKSFASKALTVAIAALVAWLPACGKKSEKAEQPVELSFTHIPQDSLQMEMAKLAPVDIVYDATILSAPEKQALAKLVEAARLMDEVFLRQVWEGNVPMRDQLTTAANTDGPNKLLAQDLLHFFNLNAGPWLRLDHDRPFIGSTPKPAGGGFYPTDMTKEEFEAAVAANPDQKAAMTGYFTRIERGPDGKSLIAVPYSDAYGAQLREAAQNLNDAADILTAETAKSQFANGVDYTTLATFLRSRAAAFISNDYFQSDMDWMDIKDNILDVTMGPYEVYEDALFNYKASFEAVIAMRNPADSKKLDELKHYLPAMERNLPIANQYKNPNRGTDSPISVVDVIHVGGDMGKGVHAIAYNLPNDERVREAKGSKKVMLKNIARAKYDKILMPIANFVLDPTQLSYVTFDAFFGTSVLHELSHGLGPGTITLPDGSKTTVNLALKTLYSPLEECKADVMGLYNTEFLVAKGFYTKENLDQAYVVFLPGFYRAVRWGLHEAHAQGNMIQYNWYKDKGAIVYDATTERYTVVLDKMPEAVKSLTSALCMVEANGDFAAAQAFVDQWGVIPAEVEKIVGKFGNIPTDVAPNYDASRFMTASM
jgi:hypothetical protein